MYIKYSFFLFVLFNLSMITASEQLFKKSPICTVDLFNVNHLIIKAKKNQHVYGNHSAIILCDSHYFTLEDGSVIEHIEFLNSDTAKYANSYTLLVRYKNKKYGIVDSTRALNLSCEQLKKLRSYYSQLYPVE